MAPVGLGLLAMLASVTLLILVKAREHQIGGQDPLLGLLVFSAGLLALVGAVLLALGLGPRTGIVERR